MERILVTVVGPSNRNPGKQRVSIGDNVYLEKETANADPFAIRVFLVAYDGQHSVGYVANSTNTVSAGTVSATDVHSSFGNDIVGKIIQETSVTFTMSNGNSRSSKAFVVELFINQVSGGVTSMSKTLKFKLVGARALYPKKGRLIEDVRNGLNPLVKLYHHEGQIVAEYEGGLAGSVEERNQMGLSDYSDIVASVVGEKIAKMTQIVTTQLLGEFTVDEEELATRQQIRSLKTVCQKLIDEGLATQQEIEERISYMKTCGITEKVMMNVFNSYKSYPEKYAALIPNPPQTLYQDVSGLVKRVVGYVNVQRNLLFEGDKGVGKNVLTETLAWLYKRPLMEFSMNSQHDNTSLLGGKTIETDEDGNNKMGFDLEITIQAAQVGGILVFDEFNTGLAHALSVFNSLLDDRRRITVPGFGVVQADKNFFAIAPQNKDYQGTFDNNEATADRFVPIIFPQLNKLKDILLAKVPQVGLTTINKCDTLFTSIKKMVVDGQISDKAITIRGFIDACLALDEDIPLKDAIIDNVANRCSDLDDRKKVLNAINAAI